MRVVVLTLLLCSFVALASAAYRPVVLMHGLFANYEAMHEIQDWLLVDFPGIYVHNADVPVQNNTNGKIDSLLIDLNKQIADFAAQLQADPRLANGFDLIGHSQGGLITRAFIERYNVPACTITSRLLALRLASSACRTSTTCARTWIARGWWTG
jgi:palmitoyl-protein thioesterase